MATDLTQPDLNTGSLLENQPHNVEAEIPVEQAVEDALEATNAEVMTAIETAAHEVQNSVYDAEAYFDTQARLTNDPHAFGEFVDLAGEYKAATIQAKNQLDPIVSEFQKQIEPLAYTEEVVTEQTQQKQEFDELAEKYQAQRRESTQAEQARVIADEEAEKAEVDAVAEMQTQLEKDIQDGNLESKLEATASDDGMAEKSVAEIAQTIPEATEFQSQPAPEIPESEKVHGTADKVFEVLNRPETSRNTPGLDAEQKRMEREQLEKETYRLAQGLQGAAEKQWTEHAQAKARKFSESVKARQTPVEAKPVEEVIDLTQEDLNDAPIKVEVRRKRTKKSESQAAGNASPIQDHDKFIDGQEYTAHTPEDQASQPAPVVEGVVEPAVEIHDVVDGEVLNTPDTDENLEGLAAAAQAHAQSKREKVTMAAASAEPEKIDVDALMREAVASMPGIDREKLIGVKETKTKAKKGPTADEVAANLEAMQQVAPQEAAAPEAHDESEALQNLAAAVQSHKAWKERAINRSRISPETAKIAENLNNIQVEAPVVQPDTSETTLAIKAAYDQIQAQKQFQAEQVQKPEENNTESKGYHRSRSFVSRFDVIRAIPFMSGYADRREIEHTKNVVENLEVKTEKIKGNIAILRENLRVETSPKKIERLKGELQKLESKKERSEAKMSVYELRRDHLVNRTAEENQKQISMLEKRVKRRREDMNALREEMKVYAAFIDSKTIEVEELKKKKGNSRVVQKIEKEIDIQKALFESSLKTYNGYRAKYEESKGRKDRIAAQNETLKKIKGAGGPGATKELLGRDGIDDENEPVVSQPQQVKASPETSAPEAQPVASPELNGRDGLDDYEEPQLVPAQKKPQAPKPQPENPEHPLNKAPVAESAQGVIAEGDAVLKKDEKAVDTMAVRFKGTPQERAAIREKLDKKNSPEALEKRREIVREKQKAFEDKVRKLTVDQKNKIAELFSRFGENPTVSNQDRQKQLNASAEKRFTTTRALFGKTYEGFALKMIKKTITAEELDSFERIIKEAESRVTKFIREYRESNKKRTARRTTPETNQ
jgi:hypothetical protein